VVMPSAAAPATPIAMGELSSTTRARRRPSLPLAILPLAVIGRVVGRLVACGFLTLSERDRSFSVTDRHILRAAIRTVPYSVNNYVDDRLGNRTLVRICPSMAFVLPLQFSVENL
jgi:hypothetical protein